MQKEQLTTQLIGAIVFQTEFGQGIIVKAEAKDDNVIMDNRYSQNSDRTFVYLVKVFCAASGYHQIEFQNSVTNKQIGKKKLTFIVDEDLHKENQEFTINGQTFELVSSFLHNPESISYPFGESLVKIDAYNSIYVTNAPPNKTDKCLLVRFCFTTLNNGDLNESVKKTTRCVVFSG